MATMRAVREKFSSVGDNEALSHEEERESDKTLVGKLSDNYVCATTFALTMIRAHLRGLFIS